MPVYDYRVVHLERTRVECEQQLQALGLDGWAMVAHQPAMPMSAERAYFMRRPDEQPKPPPSDATDDDLPFE